MPTSPNIPFKFGPMRGAADDDTPWTVSVIVNIEGLILTKYGRHAFRILVDDEEIGSVTFLVSPPEDGK